MSLDPDDWTAFSADAHAALDRAIARLRDIPDRPVWREAPAIVRAAFQQALPTGPRPFGDVLADIDALIAPYVVGNTHPLFMGWVHGAGTPYGMVAEMLAAGLNANCGGRNHIGPVVEAQIAAWMAQAFGFPADASGLFVTGASQANLLGVLIARTKALGVGSRAQGLAQTRRTAASPSMTGWPRWHGARRSPAGPGSAMSRQASRTVSAGR